PGPPGPLRSGRGIQTLHESRSAVSRSKRTAPGKLIPKLYHPNAQLRAVSLPPSRLRTKRCSELADVRFGSKADIAGRQVDVRFTPNSGHVCAMLRAERGVLYVASRHQVKALAAVLELEGLE